MRRYLEILANTAQALDAIVDTLAAFVDPVGNEFGLYEEPRR